MTEKFKYGNSSSIANIDVHRPRKDLTDWIATENSSNDPTFAAHHVKFKAEANDTTCRQFAFLTVAELCLVNLALIFDDYSADLESQRPEFQVPQIAAMITQLVWTGGLPSRYPHPPFWLVRESNSGNTMLMLTES